MEYFNSKLIIALGLLVILVSYSCTDLTEELPSEVTSDQFFQTPEQVLSAVGEAYVVMAGNGGWGSHNGLWSMHEVAADEMIIPQRGQDWFDGGIWIRNHRHTFNFEEGFINGAWTQLFQGVNASNRLIFQLEELVNEGVTEASVAAEFTAELRALRAFYYFWLLDSFGNVPIVDDFINADPSPSNRPTSEFQQGRTDVYDFVEEEFLAVVDLVSDDVSNTRGRLNKFAIHFMLGKLYLNAEVYTGVPQWEKAIEQFDIIIDDGPYDLMDNYFANFSISNSNALEHIFVIPYDEVFLPGFNLNQMTLHYGQQFEFDLQDQPWNGYATTQAFYEKFTEDDVRRDGFLTGPRFRSDGGPVLDPDFGLCPRFEDDRRMDEEHVILQVEINQLEPCAGRENGARFAKFEIQQGETPDKSNDFPIMRYGDVILSKAEALFRLGNEGDALQYVNLIRDRADLDPFDDLNFQNLLDERGRELYLEMWRRQDMIRFPGQNGGETAFNDPWDFKGVSEPFRIVFPIPRDQIQANPNLNQNPGY